MSLDLVDAFRGMVLAAAVHVSVDKDEAFVLLGQELLLKNRNHHRALKRELLRVRDLLLELGEDADATLEEMLASAEAPDSK